MGNCDTAVVASPQADKSGSEIDAETIRNKLNDLIVTQPSSYSNTDGEDEYIKLELPSYCLDTSGSDEQLFDFRRFADDALPNPRPVLWQRQDKGGVI